MHCSAHNKTSTMALLLRKSGIYYEGDEGLITTGNNRECNTCVLINYITSGVARY